MEGTNCTKPSGLMVSALDSGSNGPCPSPGQDHCVVVFLGKTLYSHSASLHPGVLTFSVYIFCPSVLTLSNLKLYKKIAVKNIFYTREIKTLIDF